MNAVTVTLVTVTASSNYSPFSLGQTLAYRLCKSVCVWQTHFRIDQVQYGIGLSAYL
jgi:hypothetical protein